MKEICILVHKVHDELLRKNVHFAKKRLKSRFLKYFLNGGSLKSTQSEEEISKNVDFSLDNRATTQTHI